MGRISISPSQPGQFRRCPEKFGAAGGCAFFVGIFENCTAADHFLGFGKLAVGDADLAASESPASTRIRAAMGDFRYALHDARSKRRAPGPPPPAFLDRS